METNISQQFEEVESLKAIYDSDWIVIDETVPSYSIEISKDVKLFIDLPMEYPSNSAPKYELLAPCLSANLKNCIAAEFDMIHRNNVGSPIIFQWIERLKEIISTDIRSVSDNEEDLRENIEPEPSNQENKSKLLNISHGTVITDRKSAFQGHVCKVQSLADVNEFIECLMENKKFAQATHNMYAYRIIQDGNVILQDCNDDGETHAGSRMLHLLQILDVTNIVVCVSRWYGGIHLGPDRFKHINNAVRQVLIQAGFVKN